MLKMSPETAFVLPEIWLLSFRLTLLPVQGLAIGQVPPSLLVIFTYSTAPAVCFALTKNPPQAGRPAKLASQSWGQLVKTWSFD